MSPVIPALKRPREVEPIYRRGIWAVTPFLGYKGERGWRPRKTLFVVTHVPTGRAAHHSLKPMRSDVAIHLCRALDREFPDFMADGAYRQQTPNPLPDSYRAVGERIKELYSEALRANEAAQAAQSKLHTVSKK